MITALRSAPSRTSFSAIASTVARRLEGSPSGIKMTCGANPAAFSAAKNFAPHRFRTGATVTTKMRLVCGNRSPRMDPARVSRPVSIHA